MNAKTLRDIAGEAGLDCEPYVADDHYPDKQCVSIITGDVANACLALVESVLDHEGEVSHEDMVASMTDLISTIRSPKQRTDGMNIIMFWPKLNWEE